MPDLWLTNQTPVFAVVQYFLSFIWLQRRYEVTAGHNIGIRGRVYLHGLEGGGLIEILIFHTLIMTVHLISHYQTCTARLNSASTVYKECKIVHKLSSICKNILILQQIIWQTTNDWNPFREVSKGNCKGRPL